MKIKWPIIVGQEIIWRENSCSQELGRVVTYSTHADYGLGFVIVRPYANPEETIKVMPEQIVELINPRPKRRFLFF